MCQGFNTRAGLLTRSRSVFDLLVFIAFPHLKISLLTIWSYGSLFVFLTAVTADEVGYDFAWEPFVSLVLAGYIPINQSNHLLQLEMPPSIWCPKVNDLKWWWAWRIFAMSLCRLNGFSMFGLRYHWSWFSVGIPTSLYSKGMNLDVLEKKRQARHCPTLRETIPWTMNIKIGSGQWQTRLLSDDFLRSLLKSNVHPNGS